MRTMLVRFAPPVQEHPSEAEQLIVPADEAEADDYHVQDDEDRCYSQE